jgi:hypothetical protein
MFTEMMHLIPPDDSVSSQKGNPQSEKYESRSDQKSSENVVFPFLTNSNTLKEEEHMADSTTTPKKGPESTIPKLPARTSLNDPAVNEGSMPLVSDAVAEAVGMVVAEAAAVAVAEAVVAGAVATAVALATFSMLEIIQGKMVDRRGHDLIHTRISIPYKFEIRTTLPLEGSNILIAQASLSWPIR